MNKLVFFTLFLFISCKSSYALIKVDITRGNLDPLPIAVSPLYVEPSSEKVEQDGKVLENIGEKISEVVEMNFKRSGLFNTLSKKSFSSTSRRTKN